MSDYWSLWSFDRARLSETEVRAMAHRAVEMSGQVEAGEHIMEDWWNRRATVVNAMAHLQSNQR